MADQVRQRWHLSKGLHELKEGDLDLDFQAERMANAKALRLGVLGTSMEYEEGSVVRAQ